MEHTTNTESPEDAILGTWLDRNITESQLRDAAEKFWDETYGDLANLRTNQRYYLHLDYGGNAFVGLQGGSYQEIIDGVQRITSEVIHSEIIQKPDMNEDDEEEVAAWQEYMDSLEEEHQATVDAWIEDMTSMLDQDEE